LSHSERSTPAPTATPAPPLPTHVGHQGGDVGTTGDRAGHPDQSGPLVPAPIGGVGGVGSDLAVTLDYDAPSGLTPKQDQAILALLSEPTISKAASALGVSERTIHRWLEDETFHRAFRKARREAFAQAIAVTQRYAPMAVHALAKVMTDGSVQASARVSAATALLKFSREALELDDLAARIEALERDGQRVEVQAGGNSRW